MSDKTCHCDECDTGDTDTCKCTGGRECNVCGNCLNHCHCYGCSVCKESVEKITTCEKCGKASVGTCCIDDHECKKTLYSLEVGDLAVVYFQYHKELAKVERVTATQIVARGLRFNRKHGRQCGVNTGHLRPATQKDIDDIERRILIDRLTSLKADEFKGIPSKILAYLVDVLAEAKKATNENKPDSQ